MSTPNKTVAISGFIASLSAGFCGLWSTFIGAIIWSQGNGTAQLIIGAAITVIFLVLAGVMLSFVFFPRMRKDEPTVIDIVEVPTVRVGNEPVRVARRGDGAAHDFEVSNDRGNGNFDVKRTER